MEQCTVEVGLLRKKPCGNTAVSKCKNCEQPLCAQHAVAQRNPAGHNTGAFMCKQCDESVRELAKSSARAAAARLMSGAPPVKKPAAAAPTPKPAAPAAPKHDDNAPLEFTPSKKPGDKK